MIEYKAPIEALLDCNSIQNLLVFDLEAVSTDKLGQRLHDRLCDLFLEGRPLIMPYVKNDIRSQCWLAVQGRVLDNLKPRTRVRGSK